MRLISQSSGSRLGVEHRLDALEIQAEGAVELVEMGFVLHQRQAREIIELVERGRDHVLFQRFEQRQEFLDRDRDLGVTQGEEEVDQHGSVLGVALNR
jgi:hypothetical protein